jgi:hypothetical protein
MQRVINGRRMEGRGGRVRGRWWGEEGRERLGWSKGWLKAGYWDRRRDGDVGKKQTGH